MKLIDIEDEALLKTVSLGGMSAKQLWKRILSEREIEAIPVEFIETWIKRAFWNGKITASCRDAYAEMIKDWMKAKDLVSPFNDD